MVATLYERLRGRYHWMRDVGLWIWRGKPAPPPNWIKQANLRALAKKYDCHVLIETGTYQGTTIEALQCDFREVISVEISKPLFEAAIRKFSGMPHVRILNGDSAELMRDVLPSLRSRALFWLDAHYSGGITGGEDTVTAIREELSLVLGDRRFQHIVVIDDARDFTGGAYPSCDEIKKVVQEIRPNEYAVTVVDDAIRLEPARHP